VTKVSRTAPNEGKCMILDMRKSLTIASIDCSANTFDSSHEDDDDESDARPVVGELRCRAMMGA